MATSTYADFKTLVANYLSRDDLTTLIPDFTRFAEDRLSRDLRTSKMVKLVTTSTDGDADLTIPDDYLGMKEIHIQGTPNYQLEFLPVDHFFRVQYSSGTPAYYTIVGEELHFSPSPSGTFTVQMVYYSKPTVMTADTDANLFLTNYPDALLYASLAEAEPYLMNDERIGTWASMYDRAIDNIKRSDKWASAGASMMVRAL